MLAPNPAREDDLVAWKLSKDGCFTNLSVYCSLLDQNQALNHNLNKFIRTWNGPERYRIHLWKISQRALVTNAFRFRRGLVASSDCPFCGREAETELHLFRDCTLAAQIWRFLSGNVFPPNFFVEELNLWLANNLRDVTPIRGVTWHLIFGVAILMIW